jgi:hypothetical protein
LSVVGALLTAAAVSAGVAKLNFAVSAFPLSVDPHFYNGIGDQSRTAIRCYLGARRPGEVFWFFSSEKNTPCFQPTPIP